MNAIFLGGDIRQKFACDYLVANGIESEYIPTFKNTDSIKWVADGVYIQEDTISVNGVCTSTIKLHNYTGDISCYVRAELNGEGGRTLTQAFVCDDGDMDSLINRTDKLNLPALDFVGAFRKLLKTVFDVFFNVVPKID